ncbi:Centromere protein W [Varanus komodoensis]|uniref:Centromere protein W n=1 Tax=Varanus komodoensis TaxID=61221 RepID=A0A8D2J0J8_VARKO|nr:centromere protein W [Varanus komodoensis]KAF7253670.1 Centromere protein W [Varanus komodoensis]
MKRTVPRSTLKRVVKKHKPHLRLGANTDLLVHLNFLLFLHRLAEEARTKAISEKSKTIKYEHVFSSAKIILKKSRG